MAPASPPSARGEPDLAKPDLPEPELAGRLAENIAHFARVLRSAGLPVGPGKVLAAIEAVTAVGLGNRTDFYWTLHAVFVNRQDQREIFDQAFHVFWKNPKLLEQMMGLVVPAMRAPGEAEGDPLSRRVSEALVKQPGEMPGQETEQEEDIEIDASMSFSEKEVLQKMDFEQMSTEETHAAEAMLKRLTLPLNEVPTRRFGAKPGHRVDFRRSLRAGMRNGGGMMTLITRRRKRRTPPLVILCDVSGSMAKYSRMMLHFMHAVTNDRDRVHAFVFGTRLTNITRDLKKRDIDDALARVGDGVQDWSGGTRIGHCLEEFNRLWSRRVLAQGAVVLLITDGLDRDAGEGLDKEIDRLHRSARRLIWLNPLLRFDGFAPKSKGVRAILPHVDEFRPVHNLESLADLAQALSRHPDPRNRDMDRWRDRMAEAAP
ncbi:MAG: VWA domain-containing protein [Alphaproteobacteria bacterium]|nr:VWA domain-containing protein [Alphaproteobacteria bacterium]